MKNLKYIFIALIAFILVGGSSVKAEGTENATFMTGENTVLVDKDLQTDAFVAGNKAKISSYVLGDLFAAGSEVEITGSTSRSVFAIGETVTLSGGFGYNTFAAGSKVILKGVYDRDVYVMAADLQVEPSAVIKGNLRYLGSSASIMGNIGGSVFLNTSNVEFNAQVAGNVTGQITDQITFIGSDGKIGGDFKYKSRNEASSLERVSIGGKVDYTNIGRSGSFLDRWTNGVSRDENFSWLGWVAKGVSLLGACLILALLMPRKIKEVQADLERGYLHNLLAGAVATVVLPLLSFLFLITLIGWRVGLVIILVYALALVLSGLVAIIVVGNYLAGLFKIKFQHFYVGTVIGVVAIMLIDLIANMAGMFSAFLNMAVYIGLMLPVLGAILVFWRRQVQ